MRMALLKLKVTLLMRRVVIGVGVAVEVASDDRLRLVPLSDLNALNTTVL